MSKTISITISDEDHELVAREAGYKRMRVSTYVRSAIFTHMAKYGQTATRKAMKGDCFVRPPQMPSRAKDVASQRKSRGTSGQT